MVLGIETHRSKNDPRINSLPNIARIVSRRGRSLSSPAASVCSLPLSIRRKKAHNSRKYSNASQSSISCSWDGDTEYENIEDDENTLPITLPYLSHEIWAIIIQYLEPKQRFMVAQVCKDWYSIVFDGFIWSEVNATLFYDSIPEQALLRLIQTGGPFIKNLNLRGCLQLSINEIPFDFSNICHLSRINLCGCRNLSTSLFSQLVLNNHQLIELAVPGLACINGSMCQKIAKNCPMLEIVDVSWCPRISYGLTHIVHCCKNLKDLKADQCSGFHSKFLLQGMNGLEKLESVSFASCIDLFDSSMELFLLGLPLTPEEEEHQALSFEPLTLRCFPPLVELNLEHCRSLTDETLETISKTCASNLRVLKLAGIEEITDFGLELVLSKSLNLENLDLEQCVQITDSSLITLAESKSASKLKTLVLSFCEQITNSGVLKILRKCSSLENLDLDNTRVTDIVLAQAAKILSRRMLSFDIALKNPKQLKLAVFDCRNITFSGVEEVLVHNSGVITCPQNGFMTISEESTPDQCLQNVQENIDNRSLSIKPIILLKCSYPLQSAVDIHTNLLLRGDFEKASRILDEWSRVVLEDNESRFLPRRGAAFILGRYRTNSRPNIFNINPETELLTGRNVEGDEYNSRRGRSTSCLIM